MHDDSSFHNHMVDLGGREMHADQRNAAGHSGFRLLRLQLTRHHQGSPMPGSGRPMGRLIVGHASGSDGRESIYV